MLPHLPNSQPDVYVGIVSNLLLDDPLTTSARMSRRDDETVRSRYQAEGISFLTKTLPKLGKAIDRSLVTGFLLVPREFKRAHKAHGIPAFMQAYFRLLYTPEGSLLEDASPLALRHVRQVLFSCYKLELPYHPNQEAAVISRFLEVEEELKTVVLPDSELIKLAAEITEEIFNEFDPMDIIPQHGPGSVSTGEKLEEKYVFRRYYHDLHAHFPYSRFFTSGAVGELTDLMHEYGTFIDAPRGIAKVVLVPKDSRGPRLISAEPLEYQWIQQGLGRKMMKHLESHKLTRGNINFTSQQINRSIALSSSKTKQFATLDLRDASDRVSKELVIKIFERKPDLLKAILGARTSATLLPDGTVVELNKYAPMGSALCFPIESYCFWVLLVAAFKLSFNHETGKAAHEVKVYGDDIIVPTHLALYAMQVLESANLAVNRDKSCYTGNFRESCGMDAFKGIQVTPLRLKTQWSGRDSDGSAYASYLSFAREIARRGYHRTASFVYEVARECYGPIPFGVHSSPFYCIEAETQLEACRLNRLAGIKVRFSDHLHRLEVRVKSLVPKVRKTTLDGWPRLLRYMTGKAGERPSETVIPRSVQLKSRWMPMHSAVDQAAV